LRRRPRPWRRPRAETRRLTARQFALLAFLVWGALLALFDWGLGSLRHPRTVVATTAREKGPPPAMFPEPKTAPRAAAATRLALPSFAGATAAPELGLLIVPVAGVAREELVDSFADPRGGGRRHEAIDILAPRNSLIVAAGDGVVDRLFTSKA